MEVIFDSSQQVFHLRNKKLSYLIQLERFGYVTHLYFGQRLEHYSGIAAYPRIHRDFEVESVEFGADVRDFSVGNLLYEYSQYNRGDFRHPALVLRHADGSTVSDFRYDRHEIVAGSPILEGLPHAKVDGGQEAVTLKLYLKDALKSLELVLSYTIFEDQAVVVRSVALHNKGSETSRVEKISSFQLDLSPRQAELIHLNGTWARERFVEREAIHHGIKVLDSKRGTSSHHQSPYMAIVAPETTEHLGQALGAQLIYSGSFEMSVQMDSYDQIRLQAGIQSLGLDWELAPGESFQTPQVVLAYSNRGLNGLSQAYHDFVSQHLIPSRFRGMERPILINNWEATYFDFDQPRLHALIDQAADLGIELFVLDDGWFGQRNHDNSSLGDWFEQESKLPQGLVGLSDYVHGKGMKFGLWFEPEMISENSNLFREHPEWAIQTPGRSLTPGRQQLVLNMANPDVRDNLFQQISKILNQVPIDYIKWDMNRHLTEVYALHLPGQAQGQVAHRYTLGVYELMERLTNAYPYILFESCSGGGGRFDLGILAYMPQTWTSDNTDAVERLKIQYGTSMMVPQHTMGAHVSAVPNHQTHRVTPLATRAQVAYFGDFGYELDLTKLPKEELESIRQQVNFYKRHRALFQFGRFSRLLSPFQDKLTAWMVVSPEQDQAMVLLAQTLTQAAMPLQVLKLQDLCPERRYQVKSEEQEFVATGAELMQVGFYVFPQLEGDYASRLYHVKALVD